MEIFEPKRIAEIIASLHEEEKRAKCIGSLNATDGEISKAWMEKATNMADAARLIEEAYCI